jgi:chorismate mutase / prephenate dehydratase
MDAETKIVENPRSLIDAIDRQIMGLLNERARIALEVGAAKLSSERSLCDPVREREVLDRLCDENTGPFPNESIRSIFQRVIDESLHLQQGRATAGTHPSTILAADLAFIDQTSRIGYLGSPGSFSHEAAMGVGGESSLISFNSFEAMFTAFRANAVDLILLPLENSSIGPIRTAMDLLLDSECTIAAEVILPVTLDLIASDKASMEKLRTVISHPAALAQCERFFAANPQLQAVEAEDTASAVQRAVASGDGSMAAIGSPRTAELYGGTVLREAIQDRPDNYTRFGLLSAQPLNGESGGKISVALKLRNEPGALHNALRPFVRRGIDLLKIESLPIKEEPGQFYFWMDLAAPAHMPEWKGAFDEIVERSEEVKYLGQYPTVELSK